jgi:hypothetical protein
MPRENYFSAYPLLPLVCPGSDCIERMTYWGLAEIHWPDGRTYRFFMWSCPACGMTRGQDIPEELARMTPT